MDKVPARPHHQPDETPAPDGRRRDGQMPRKMRARRPQQTSEVPDDYLYW